MNSLTMVLSLLSKEEIHMKQIFKKGVTLLFFLNAFALQAKSIDLKNEAFIEKEDVAKDGKKSKKLVPATNVVPGEEVIFVITYRNIGKEAATDIVVTNPIPKNMTFKAAEAEASARSEVSIDGGKAYGDLANLKVTDKLRKQRPALPADVTHVRWKVAGAVQPNAQGKLRLKAVLN